MTEELRPDNDLFMRWHAVHEKHRAEKARILAMVMDYLDHVPEENEYLIRKGQELMIKIKNQPK